MVACVQNNECIASVLIMGCENSYEKMKKFKQLLSLLFVIVLLQVEEEEKKPS